MTDRQTNVVTFRTNMPIAETMVFESVYEKSLQFEQRFKSAVIRDGIAVWMFVDGKLAGETFGISPAVLEDDLDDLPARDPSVMYCYSTTLLPEFQKKHLSKLLCAYWLGMVKQAGFRVVAGHATSAEMIAVKTSFGARFSTIHTNWFGSARTANFYELVL